MVNAQQPCHSLTKCTVCHSGDLQELITLPKFPFTGIYCDPSTKLHDFIYQGVDQGLMLCPHCGHSQLKVVVDPALVYDSTYTHRGSTSPIAKQGNEFFAAFLEKLFPGRVFNKILDVGCNDGYLLKQLESKGKQLLGVDPIWIGKDHNVSQKTSIIGGFIENIDLKQVLGDSPDLIVSAHTFEHIENPRNVLSTILSQAKEGAVLIIEVPSFDTLVRNHRFDQVFHQHIQYFSLASFNRMVHELGCSYLAHTFNYSMWGGTMLFAFQKIAVERRVEFEKRSKDEVLKSFKGFIDSLNNLAETLSSIKSEKIYGFGAAQMLPCLVYHVPNKMKEVTEILDDNPDRQGRTYPDLHFKISTPSTVDLQEADVVITALDSARPIIERLVKLKPKRILMPIQVI